ncbi:MAG: sensor histidine kinase [Chloroflexi bacterium]|nr:sensor histidine kinase [Chloroflexota bacterium]
MADPSASQNQSDDYRYTQRVTVVVRWFLLAAWLFVLNYRGDRTGQVAILNTLGVMLGVVNGYVQWRLVRGWPVGRRHVIGLSLLDLAIISAGIGMTSRFDNSFFVFYYPALLGVGLVFPSRRASFAVFALTAVAYTVISIWLPPGVSYTAEEEKILFGRLASMLAVVVAGNLVTEIERKRRRAAVDGERAQAQRAMELQERAQKAELAAQEERNRIAREIHDGIAQSIYALNLNLETCAEIARNQPGPLAERLQRLVPLAKQTLLETRHYIYDLKPLLAGQNDLPTVVRNQCREFGTVSGIPVTVDIAGEAHPVPVPVASACYRVLQEALANVLKHARSSRVVVGLEIGPDKAILSVKDDGRGFDVATRPPGYGIENMRQRAEELGGSLRVESQSGHGTTVTMKLPLVEVTSGTHQGDDRR